MSSRSFILHRFEAKLDQSLQNDVFYHHENDYDEDHEVEDDEDNEDVARDQNLN